MINHLAWEISHAAGNKVNKLAPNNNNSSNTSKNISELLQQQQQQQEVGLAMCWKVIKMLAQFYNRKASWVELREAATVERESEEGLRGGSNNN